MATVGVVGAVGVATPILLSIDGAEEAWATKPYSLPVAAAERAADTCQQSFGHPTKGERVVLAERRGSRTYVLLTGRRTEIACLMPDSMLGQPGTERFVGSYTPDATAPPRLPANGFDEGTTSQSNTNAGVLTLTEGYVGSDVRRVTVRTSTGLRFEASVAGNRFAAWWLSEEGSQQSAETWSYTVHLADGSTRNVG